MCIYGSQDLLIHIQCPSGIFNNYVERRWTSSSSLIYYFNHGHQAWDEYSKWGRINAPYNLWRSAGVISVNDTFMAIIIELVLLAAVVH